MAKVDHDTRAVHFGHHLASKVRQTAVFVGRAACRVADVVVAVVTERDVHHAHLCKSSHIVDVASQSVAILNAAHDGQLAFKLVAVQVGRCACKCHIGCVSHACLNLVEQFDSHLCGLQLLLFRASALRQISHHGSGIEVSLAHFRKVDKQLWVASGKFHPFVKEHGRVAVRVESEHMLVHPFGSGKLCGVGYKVLKQRHHAAVAFGPEAFGVPLHANDALHVGALDSLNHPVGRACRHPKVRARFAHGLVVEGVDGKACAQQPSDHRVGLGRYKVCGHPAVSVL